MPFIVALSVLFGRDKESGKQFVADHVNVVIFIRGFYDIEKFEYEGLNCFAITEIYALWIQSYYLFWDSGCHNKCASEMCLNKTFRRNYLKPLDIEQLLFCDIRAVLAFSARFFFAARTICM
jgi:hypothetical protein